MNLVIVESPTKAKTLSKFLGKDYEVKASMGHIRDLPKKGMAIDIEHGYKPSYEVPDKSKKTLDDLKKISKGASQVILATDPDREGEAIAWHLKELLKSKEIKEFKRVVFHELTKGAIQEAFLHPLELNLALVDAQQARRVLDRLVGYKLSPLLWKKVRYGLSAGRVQSVAVRLIVDRERERLAFKPEEYWSIFSDFVTGTGSKFSAELVEYKKKKIEIKNSDQANTVKLNLQNDIFSISVVKKSERQRKPYAPFKTSTLQQSSANVFGFTAKRTMQAAQKLFEQGFITYHRTDSLNLSPQFVDLARDYIKSSFGVAYLPETGVVYKTNAKNAQEAHEAIRITDPSLGPNNIKKTQMTEDELKVYSLIWKRSLECQMLPAIYDQTAISVDSKGGYTFKATGSIVKFEGWLKVGNSLNLEEEEEEIRKLPDVEEGSSVDIKNIKSDQHFTQPPARYSDATLIKALEEMSIGRPSTYAPTITTIQSRGYVSKDGKYFVPADVAYVVIDLLVAHFPEIVDFQFTAQMEDDLDDIADGKKEWVPVIDAFYKPFEKTLEKKDKELKKTDVTNLGESGESCPDCGKPLVFKLGKYGKFLSCSGYPDCSYAKPLVSDTDSKQDYGKCPNCEDGIFILKQGKFGKFLACSNYPKCKTTQKYLEKIGMKCPKCVDGEVIVKKARGRVFYGCSRYPECDYSSWKNPLPKEEVLTISADEKAKEN